MFRPQEEKNVDFLTRTDLHKPNLHKVETELKDNPDNDKPETDEAGEKDTPQTENTFSKIMEKVEEKVEPDIVYDSKESEKIRMKIRFDYRGTTRPARFFFGKKSVEEAAEELRDQKMSLWQNIPLQGIEVEDIKVFDIYTIVEEDDDFEEEVAYAPIEIIVSADSLEDCAYLISREEFRRVEILQPAEISLSSKSMEKIFVKFSEFFRRFYNEYR